MIHPLLKAFIIGIISSTLVIPFTFTRLYKALELRFYDQRLKLRPQRPVTDKVTLIAIDDNSIKTLGRWPWTRDKHAALIDTLCSLGAKTIIMDIEFLEESPPTLEKGLVEDKLREVKERLKDISQGIQSLPQRATSKEGETSQELFDYYSTVVLEEGKALETDIEKIIVDHDEALTRATALSNRTILAFHPVESLHGANSLLPIYPALKELLLHEEAVSIEKLTKRLFLKERQQKDLAEVFTLVKKQVVLETLLEGLEKNPQATQEELMQAIPKGLVEETALQDAYSKARLMHHVGKKFGKDIRISNAGKEKTPSVPFLETPIYPLLEACKDLGHTAMIPDFEDGTLRKMPLWVKRGDKYYLQLALQAVCDYLGVKDEDLTLYPGKLLSITTPSGEEIGIPINPYGQALVDFTGRPGPLGWRETFPILSYTLPIELWQIRKDSNTLWEALDGKYLGGTITRLKQALSAETSPTKKEELKRQIEEKSRELVDFIQLSIKKSTDLLEKEPDEGRKGQLALALEEMQQELSLLKRLETSEREFSSRLRKQVEDKICLVGAIFTGGTDFSPTPYDPACPNVITHCNIVDMILKRHFLNYDRKAHNIPTIILLGPVMGLITSALGSLVGGGALAGVMGLYLIASYLLLTYLGVWLHVAGPLIAMVTSYTAVTVYRQLTVERQRREIKNLFQHYLHPEVVNELVKDPTKVKLGGVRKELTIQFSDIQGFTSLSEKMQPGELEAFLNTYLTAMTDVVLKHGGTVDKYEGDAIMAFYGAPIDQPDHALRACKAALEARETQEALNLQFKGKGWPTIRTRFGINTGPAVVGNMGTNTRFDYTAIGDSVNLASRLESANKIFGTTILLGQETYEYTKKDIFAIYLGLVQVKGKAQSVKVYALVSLAGDAPPQDQELDRLLSTATSLYYERKWKEALEYFSRVLTLRPGFSAAEIYSIKCRTYVDIPPGSDWTGALVLEEK